ncbi:DNRLRE domain-containing protein [Micromonospora sp. DR5-3]|uniref:CBM96 family carbohydrate-binding protein n=1 Tax=unclassified Micromonospora TaxID=2617518 RepID=UPI0011D8AABA|nr:MULTISPECIES: DNRLRE domain-containing protein [unclassified Micromonospora]MCW3813903.1 DNRLRE domain-containing protein [Micromonospora sp. DR5-3]TYC24553.1 DNRLRE domain-containing protein [Micromonospora sp. MP36]
MKLSRPARPRTASAVVAMFVAAGLTLVLTGRAESASPTCRTSSAPSGAYTVLVCLTQPASGGTLVGDATVTATVNVTAGTSPGVAKTEWSLDGQYLITDFQSPHQFTISSADFVDGAHVIGVSAKMRDGYVTPETLVTVTFANGNATTPTNTRQWSVPPITARAPQEPFVVAAVGDGAGGETNALNVTNALVGWNPDLFLYLGDVYEDGTLTEFKNWYGGPTAFFGRLRGVTTPVVGNHEYTGNTADGYFNYWDNIPHYYSYDANGWHFIAIDSTSNYNKVAPGTPQYEWLVADLAANRSPCTMVFWHHPLFSIGSEDPAPRMQAMWDLMAAHHVTMLVTAHDHNYQRWTPMGAGGVPAADGVVEVVVGGGGHSSQGFLSSDTRVVKTNKSYGAMRMELFGNRAELHYHAAGSTGTTLVDSSTVSCKGADRLAPTSPAGLTATADDTPTVSLHWTPATDNYGLTGYRVYRDGTALADLPPTATSWTDTSVAGATAYEYTLDAADAAGNRSAPTPPVAVTTPGPDTTPPTVPGGLTATPSPAAVTLTWSLATDNVGVTGYHVLRDGAVVATVTDPAYADTGVPPDEPHRWTVRAVDGASNVSAESDPVTAVRDTVAPSAPPNLRATDVTPGAVGLAWDPSTDNVGVARYQVFRDGSFLTQVSSGHTFVDDTVGTSRRSYTYLITAVDAAGNASGPSNQVTVTTPDANPPTAPTNLQASVLGPNRVGLSWEPATDDFGVAGYTVYRNGTAIGTTTGTTFTDGTALSETSYAYAVSTFDAAGNSSAPSTPILVTTPAATPFVAVADTYVKASSPTSRYGSTPVVRVDGDPVTNAYLKFTVSGLTGEVRRARLKVWVAAGSSSGFAVRPVADSSWSETLTNWDNAPLIDSTSIAASGRTTTGTWITLDITSLISGNGTITVGLTSSGASSSSYGSRESDTPPQVLVDVTS